MSGLDGAVKVVRLNEPGGELLDARYYCTVDNNEKLNVVIKLKASTNITTSNIPQRYVILMDVSGSMNEEVKGDNRSLLERIKIRCKMATQTEKFVIFTFLRLHTFNQCKNDGFAIWKVNEIFGYLFVNNVTEGTWLSIVTFSNKGEIVLPMTKMDKGGRIFARSGADLIRSGPDKVVIWRLAKQAIENVKTIGMTNISDGLFESLKAIESSGSGELTRDCIILFSDGQANEGILDAPSLVSEFKLRAQKLQRSNGIPVSAITIGDNQPFFLNQVATGLGSDSFYWLNETGNFEADMLLPMLLRESPSISDVTMEMACQNEVTFFEDAVGQPTLQSRLNDKSRTYMIHFIPSGMERNIYLSLDIGTAHKQLDGEIILEVWKSFLDNNLKEHKSTDYLELRLTSMKQLFLDTFNKSKNGLEDSDQIQTMNVGPDALNYLQNTSSYSASRNQTRVSWEDAQESMVNVLGQRCRLETISAIETSAELVDRGQDNKAKQSCQQALANIENIEKITEDVLGKDNPHCRSLQDTVKHNFQEKLEFITDDVRKFNPGRLTAMASSFSTEMPTGGEVFNPDLKQPFMPSDVDKKHDSYKQIVSEITKHAREHGDYRDFFDSDSSSTTSEPPEIIEVPELPPVTRVVYMSKPSHGEPEEYDPDSLFFASILPDLQQLDSQKKFEIKMDILRLIHTALYKY